MKRVTLQKILKFLLDHLTRYEFFGTEHIPLTGKLLVATNHVSRLDVPMLFITPNRLDITALVADKYKKDPFFSFLVRSGEAIWIDRSKADFAAFRVAQDALNKGLALGIAPEGTRSKDARLAEGKPGIALIAMRGDIPIVPVGISGTESAIKQLFTFRRPHIVVRYGPLFRLPPLDLNDRQGSLQRATDEIMCRIAALLPESYRGVYRDHPRLKEFLPQE
jgi:1-acyl-sn-glycerol-3-phosphate acyltransferase